MNKITDKTIYEVAQGNIIIICGSYFIVTNIVRDKYNLHSLASGSIFYNEPKTLQAIADDLNNKTGVEFLGSVEIIIKKI